jgi:hypothetical protein
MTNRSFPTFFDVAEPLMENVQAAKDYLIKQYADKKGIKPSEIDAEEKKVILSSKIFTEIRDMLQKSPGYTLAFLKFRMDQKAQMDELKEILEMLQKYKGQINELPMSVEDYAKYVVKKDDEDRRPGFELLGDELRNFERKRKVKDFYNELTPRMKKAFSSATDVQIEELTAISNKLKSLSDIKTEEGNANAWKSFSKNMKKYDDTRTYPEYSDEKKAFKDLIKDALEFTESWGQSEDKLLGKIKSLGPQAGIIYAKKGYIVMSARTPEAQRAICADTNWCIRTDSTFWSYATGRIQLNIINSNVPVTDPLSLIGITINPDGTVHTDANRPNSRLRDSGGNTFRTYKSALKELGYPEDLIEAVDGAFQREVDIKVALENYYREGSKLEARKIIESLITISRGFLAGTMDQSEWDNIAGIITEIIVNDKGLSKSQFMKVFTQHGIFSEATWKVFDAIIGNDYTKEEMEEILSSIERNLEGMGFLIRDNDNGDVQLTKKVRDNIESILADRDIIIRRIKDRI